MMTFAELYETLYGTRASEMKKNQAYRELATMPDENWRKWVRYRKAMTTTDELR